MRICSDTSDLHSKNTGSRKTFKQVTHTQTHTHTHTRPKIYQWDAGTHTLSHSLSLIHTHHTQKTETIRVDAAFPTADVARSISHALGL
jgi:hypothetical protein